MTQPKTLPESWPFPSVSVEDQRAEVVGMTVPEGKSKGRKYCCPRPPQPKRAPIDLPDAPF